MNTEMIEMTRKAREIAIAEGNNDAADRLQVVIQFYTNPDFRQALTDYSFAATYKA